MKITKMNNRQTLKIKDKTQIRQTKNGVDDRL